MKVSHRILWVLPLLAGVVHGQMPGTTEHVQVEKVTIGKDRITRKSIGHMEAIRSVSVKAPVEGFLKARNFEEGAFVNEGDVLFEIDPVRYKAAVKQAEAAVTEIEAQIIYANKNCQRLQRLAFAQATSVEAMESALARLKELRALRSGALADLAKADKDLADCTIKAEITGRIGRAEFSEGNYITRGEALATIKQMDPIYVRFPLSQTDVNGIFRGPKEIGNVADVHLTTANGRRYPHAGKVAIVDNLLSSTTDTYTLWAEFSNKDSVLTPRGIGAMHISLNDTQQVCMVPLTAVHYDADGAFVYTVSEGENKVARQEVITGAIQGRLQAVYTGLKEGETIITDGAHKIRVGDTVIPVYTESDSPVDETGRIVAEEKPVEVELTPVVKAQDKTVLVCQGARIEAVNRVSMRPLVQGVLAEPHFREGDRVNKGDILFNIDPTRYQAVVDARKAAVAQLDVRVKDAARKYERQQALATTSATSKDDLESAKATLDELTAQRQKAEAALTIAEDDLSRCTMRAPISGRIGRTSFSKGNYISDIKQPLATVVQLSPIYVRFSLSENAILSNYGTNEKIKSDADVTLVTASGNTYREKGRVALCDNIIQTATDTQNVWAVFRNEDGELQPGGVVTIRVSRKADKPVPAVDSRAILIDTSGHYVYVMRHKRAVQVRVLCGTPDENGLTPVFAGLNEGDQCITGPLAEIEDGTLVAPAATEANK